MTERSNWNEWVIRDYMVLGIFVGQSCCMVWRKDSTGNTGGVDAFPPDIQATFPEQRLLAFDGNGGIVQYRVDAGPTPVAHAEFYHG